MQEHPILFNGDMVRAILDGRKTQTRRLVQLEHVYDIDDTGTPLRMNDDGVFYPVPCPHGQPGDRLWVRETWRIGAWREHRGVVAIDYAASPELKNTPWVTISDDVVWNRHLDRVHDELAKLNYPKTEVPSPLCYEGLLGYPKISHRYVWEPGCAPLAWRPSIHMPRWASRITLEVTGVRVERLRDITEEDARKEGVAWSDGSPMGVLGPTYLVVEARKEFEILWDSIYAKRPGHAWNDNPWVWVTEFKHVPQEPQS